MAILCLDQSDTGSLYPMGRYNIPLSPTPHTLWLCNLARAGTIYDDGLLQLYPHCAGGISSACRMAMDRLLRCRGSYSRLPYRLYLLGKAIPKATDAPHTIKVIPIQRQLPIPPRQKLFYLSMAVSVINNPTNLFPLYDSECTVRHL